MSDVVEIPIVAEDPPGYARPGDAGADLRSTATVVLAPGERALLGTGVSIALPEGYAGFVMPRSGLAVSHGVTVLNAPGVIDAGYRGEIKVPLINTDRAEAFQVEAGDRIAQLVIAPVSRAVFVRVPRLPLSERGERGFGSTGVREREA